MMLSKADACLRRPNAKNKKLSRVSKSGLLGFGKKLCENKGSKQAFLGCPTNASERGMPAYVRNPRESGDPVLRSDSGDYWIPAFAGISGGGCCSVA